MITITLWPKAWNDVSRISTIFVFVNFAIFIPASKKKLLLIFLDHRYAYCRQHGLLQLGRLAFTSNIPLVSV
jgi:hypothetical protein